MPAPFPALVHRNGQPATANALAPLAFAGYAHFTAAQVRGGGIRGLDLHLRRLRQASLALFGQALPDEQVRTHLRTALADSPADLSLTATIHSPAGEFTARHDAPLDILIRTAPPTDGPAGPLSLAAVMHERVLPGIKHVGEIAKTYYLRDAVAQGFDDAAFIDRQGRISEASIWNMAFWDGTGVIWPDADMLPGVTMAILRRQLMRLGIEQRVQAVTLNDLDGMAGAVVMNSWTPAVPVHRMGGIDLPEANAFVATLRRAYEAEPRVAP
jgi:branched-subunit amino acid aminotransferase/4-amino-4-deoxychorismate lyase